MTQAPTEVERANFAAVVLLLNLVNTLGEFLLSDVVVAQAEALAAAGGRAASKRSAKSS